jgi:HlyD family secretion protein
VKNKNREHVSDIAETIGLDSTPKRGKHLKRWILWGLIVLIIALGIIWWGTSKSADTIQYKTRVAEKGSLTVTVTATGNIQPTNKVEVGSELSGIIKSVEVDYNDSVKIGQALAKLDTEKLEAQVLQSRATLESSQAKVLQVQATITESKNQLERLQYLSKISGNKAVSVHDLDAAKAALARAEADKAAARASVDLARATLEVNETDLSKAVIYSPINGIVLTRSVEPGQTVAASFQAPVLFTLAEDLSMMELHVDVDEADVGQVQEGQRSVFTVDAYPDRSFPAHIRQVRYGSKTVDGVVTYETVLVVDNSDLSLRPGMTATADIVVKEIENTVLIPNAALRYKPASAQTGSSSGGGSIMSRIFPRPRMSAPARERNRGQADRNRQQLWTLIDGKPGPVMVTIGSTDGLMTQVINGDITPGMELIVAVESVKP